MKSALSTMLLFVLSLLLDGCVGILPIDSDTLPIDRGRLPPSDISIVIPDLGPCTDGIDRTLQLDSRQPVTILVHGCRGSAGRFRALAEVFAFHGQQTACFSYDDRDSLLVSATQLAAGVDALAAKMQNHEVNIIGHSQGGLVARRALVPQNPELLQRSDLNVRLVSISAPFAGIAASSHCGSKLAGVLSLGLTVPICKIISGDKWYEITEYSDFIRQPGKLIAQVREHLKIVTDESGSCRRYDTSGLCINSDFVFSLEEQKFPVVDEQPDANILVVKAGHVEIVGDQRTNPLKLISLLQEHQFLAPTEPGRKAALNGLLTLLYSN